MGESGFEGLKISHYIVLDRLGAGAMGEVYRAEDLKLKRFVALKFLPQSLIADSGSARGLSRAEALQRFWQEGRAVAALNHPGICTIFAIEDYDGQPFIVMELLEGATLREKLADIAPAPLDVSQILNLGVQIADALEAAHERGVIHRDLKPANLFVTLRGHAKILDFGLAKRKPLATAKASVGSAVDLDEASAISWGLENSPTISTKDRDLTNPGTLLGTIAYMSPEQALGEKADERTDIFSLGAVLYEMAAGRRAFTGQTPLAVSDAIIHHDPPPASESNPQLPPDLNELIRKCLAKKPEHRFQTAAELRAELQVLRDSLPHTQGLRRGKRTPLRPNLNRHRVRLFLVGGLLAAAVVALAVPVSREWLQDETDRVLHRSQEPALPSHVNLAVLPFAGATSDPKLTAFGNGLADELSARLAQLTLGRSFQVTPASELRDKRVTTLDQARHEFGSNLGIQIALQRSEGIVRVSYTFIDSASGHAVRADSIAAAESDLVSLEDRVVESAARSLGLEVHPEEQRMHSFRGTASAAAYDYYLQGVGYLQQSDDPTKVSSALETLREALRLDPQFGLAEAALGEAYCAQYEKTKDRQWIEPARAACAHAIALGTAGAEGHACLGTLANETGDYAGSATQFQLAVQLDPSSDRAYDSLATADVNLNRVTEAEITYQRAINLRPGYWYPYNKLGVLYFQQQDYAKARQMFKKVVEMSPDSYRGYLNVGAIDLALNDMTSAISELERANAIQPSELACSDLGSAYFFQGNYQKAAREFQEAINFSPKEADSWGFLADSYYYSGDRSRAMPAYRHAIELGEDSLKVNPNDSASLGLLADFHAMVGERGQALSEIDRALASGQPDQTLYFNACEVYDEVGEKEIALEWLAKALAAGYPPYLVEHAPGLNNLHSDPRYKQLLGLK